MPWEIEKAVRVTAIRPWIASNSSHGSQIVFFGTQARIRDNLGLFQRTTRKVGLFLSAD